MCLAIDVVAFFCFSFLNFVLLITSFPCNECVRVSVCVLVCFHCSFIIVHVNYKFGERNERWSEWRQTTIIITTAATSSEASNGNSDDEDGDRDWGLSNGDVIFAWWFQSMENDPHSRGLTCLFMMCIFYLSNFAVRLLIVMFTSCLSVCARVCVFFCCFSHLIYICVCIITTAWHYRILCYFIV